MDDDRALPLPPPRTPILDLGWFYVGRDAGGSFHFHINGKHYFEEDFKEVMLSESRKILEGEAKP